MEPVTGHYIITIDGVSGSGKSSTARTVAKELGILHLDTGAMYRSVTLLCQQKGIPASKPAEVAAFTATLQWEVDEVGHFKVSGKDLLREIRTAEVNAAVSDYAKIPEVRKLLVQVQRRIGMRQSAVVEGRDMATVVFPDAQFKFFMYASPEVRAQRRVRELQLMNHPADYAEVLKNLADRDEKDSGREHSPLAKAQDAIEIDTSGLTFAEQVSIIVSHVLGNLSRDSLHRA